MLEKHQIPHHTAASACLLYLDSQYGSSSSSTVHRCWNVLAGEPKSWKPRIAFIWTSNCVLVFDPSLTGFSRSCDFYTLGCDRSLLRSDVHDAESILEVGTAALSQTENAAWQELNNHFTARTTWWPDLMFNGTAQRQVSKQFLGI